MTNTWYNKAGYRWISISLAMTCVAAMLSFTIIDLSTGKCNDSYHNIYDCLNSTSCDTRYCEPSSCTGYTCLPRLSNTCMEDNILYYIEGKCPKPKPYNTSLIIIIFTSILAADLLLFVITLIHDKCTQTYAELYLDDEISDRLIKGQNVKKKHCNKCRGVIDGCNACNGTGLMIESQSDIDELYY